MDHQSPLKAPETRHPPVPLDPIIYPDHPDYPSIPPKRRNIPTDPNITEPHETNYDEPGFGWINLDLP
jgi:hypothetical protein